jgi:hypothetical protein
VFVEAEGGAAGIGPSFAVTVVGFLVAFLDIVEFAAPEDAAFLAGAVIGEEEDEGILVGAGFFKKGDEFPNILIDAIDHGGVDGHLDIHFVALFLVEGMPLGDGGGARGEQSVFAEETEFFLFLEALFAEFVPADFVFAAVFGDIVFEGLEGPVRGGVGEVEKGGAILIYLFFFEKLDGVVGVGVGGVECFVGGAFRGIDIFVAGGHAAGVFRVEEAGGTGDAAVEFFEAALEGPAIFVVVAEVPLSGHEGGVSLISEDLGDGDALVIDVALVGGGFGGAASAFGRLGHPSDTGLVWVEAGHEGGAGGAAAAAVVELGEADTAVGEGVEVRGFDLATVITEVGEAHVIDHDEDDMGAFGCGSGGSGEGEEGEESDEGKGEFFHGEDVVWRVLH